MEKNNRLYKGQALLELAIFGSILIMLLGILINYGLRYVYQQQVMQQAFRQALASAAVSMEPHTPISTSHIVIRDRHIPNPTDPFAVGSVMSFASGASVIRSYRLDDTPDAEDELPYVIFDIQGQKIALKAEDEPKLDDGYTQVTTINNKLDRSQSGSDISATDTLNWQTVTDRTIISNNQNMEVKSVVSQNKIQQW